MRNVVGKKVRNSNFLISLYFFRKIGFYGVFATSAAFLFVNLVYTIFVIKEPMKHKRQEAKIKNNKIADFFDIDHVANTFKVAFRQTEDKRRKKIIAILIVTMLVIGPLHGEIAVTYLFTRFKFKWSEVEYSIFSTYSMTLQLIGTLFAVSYLSKKLKINDCVSFYKLEKNFTEMLFLNQIIGVIASSSKVLASFMYCFAATGHQFFIGPIIEVMKEAVFISLRSIATKLVESDELVRKRTEYSNTKTLSRFMDGNKKFFGDRNKRRLHYHQ